MKNTKAVLRVVSLILKLSDIHKYPTKARPDIAMPMQNIRKNANFKSLLNSSKKPEIT